MPSTAKPKILAFAGSARADSCNKKLIRAAISGAIREQADVTLIDLRDYALPLYDADLESASGLPANAKKLKELFANHQGLLISSPEYNSSITPLLKNTLDWISRTETGEGSLACYDGKVAGLLSASPGALGGLRGLVHLRAILGNIKVLVIPEQFALSRAYEAFLPDGSFKDSKQLAAAQGVASALVKLLKRLTA